LEFLHRKDEPQRAQSFKIYLCVTLRELCDLCGKIKNEFQLRNSYILLAS